MKSDCQERLQDLILSDLLILQFIQIPVDLCEEKGYNDRYYSLTCKVILLFELCCGKNVLYDYVVSVNMLLEPGLSS